MTNWLYLIWYGYWNYLFITIIIILQYYWYENKIIHLYSFIFVLVLLNIVILLNFGSLCINICRWPIFTISAYCRNILKLFLCFLYTIFLCFPWAFFVLFLHLLFLLVHFRIMIIVLQICQVFSREVVQFVIKLPPKRIFQVYLWLIWLNYLTHVNILHWSSIIIFLVLLVGFELLLKLLFGYLWIYLHYFWFIVRINEIAIEFTDSVSKIFFIKVFHMFPISN